MAKWDAKKKPCLLQSLPAQQGIRFLLLICPNMESAGAAPRSCCRGWRFPELEAVYSYAAERWKIVSLRATSIGAWFSMLALQAKPLRGALLLSSVVDMEDLITNMMQWANVSEAQLKEAGEISTDFDETLSWQYLCWVREHPYRWKVPTQVLYGAKDNLTSRAVLEQFKQRTGAHLTIMEEGEHWFHTELQLAVLQEWERAHI